MYTKAAPWLSAPFAAATKASSAWAAARPCRSLPTCTCPEEKIKDKVRAAKSSAKRNSQGHGRLFAGGLVLAYGEWVHVVEPFHRYKPACGVVCHVLPCGAQLTKSKVCAGSMARGYLVFAGNAVWLPAEEDGRQDSAVKHRVRNTNVVTSAICNALSCFSF